MCGTSEMEASGWETDQRGYLTGSRLFGKVMVKFLGFACLFVLCGILVAGLWPFRIPKNDVSWLGNGNGVLLGDFGSILSAAAFKTSPSKGGPCTLEIWLHPTHLSYSGVILAYYRPEHLVVPFQLRQFSHYLMVQGGGVGQRPYAKRAHIFVDNLFVKGKPVLITISSGPEGTTVYADGSLVERFPDFGFSSQDLTGELVIGNAPLGTDTWPGQVKGLAVYDREFTADEAFQHRARWATNKYKELADSESIVALYLFDEGHGQVVRNQVDSSTNLHIPERFVVLHEGFLKPFWEEFRAGWGYWKDIGINITGFIPLGFSFCAYFSLAGRVGRPSAVTVLLGFFVSLTIEILQAFLPTRDSGTTDVITNTLGTALGAMMFTFSTRRFGLTKLVSKSVRRSETKDEVAQLAE